MEGAWWLATGQSASFSEQQILDCSWGFHPHKPWANLGAHAAMVAGNPALHRPSSAWGSETTTPALRLVQGSTAHAQQLMACVYATVIAVLLQPATAATRMPPLAMWRRRAASPPTRTTPTGWATSRRRLMLVLGQPAACIMYKATSRAACVLPPATSPAQAQDGYCAANRTRLVGKFKASQTPESAVGVCLVPVAARLEHLPFFPNPSCSTPTRISTVCVSKAPPAVIACLSHP
jgi:hypothetical protein